MRKIQAAVIGQNEERLLVLAEWLDWMRGPHLPDLIERCIHEKIRATHPAAGEDHVGNMVANQTNEIICRSSPPTNLHAQYGDWWRVILDSWLQEGWLTLFCFEPGDGGAVAQFVEVMDCERVNQNIRDAEPPPDHEYALADQFFSE